MRKKRQEGQRTAGEMEEISRNVSFSSVQPEQKAGKTRNMPQTRKPKLSRFPDITSGSGKKLRK